MNVSVPEHVIPHICIHQQATSWYMQQYGKSIYLYIYNLSLLSLSVGLCPFLLALFAQTSLSNRCQSMQQHLIDRAPLPLRLRLDGWFPGGSTLESKATSRDIQSTKPWKILSASLWMEYPNWRCLRLYAKLQPASQLKRKAGWN